MGLISRKIDTESAEPRARKGCRNALAPSLPRRARTARGKTEARRKEGNSPTQAGDQTEAGASSRRQSQAQAGTKTKGGWPSQMANKSATAASIETPKHTKMKRLSVEARFYSGFSYPAQTSRNDFPKTRPKLGRTLYAANGQDRVVLPRMPVRTKRLTRFRRA